MHGDIALIEKLRQSSVVATKMIYPDRRISQYHHLERRRGGALASGWVPPIRASRRPASRSTNAFKASRITADFSLRPAYSCAFANNSSSIATVVRISVSSASDISSFDADFYATGQQVCGSYA